MQRKLISFDVLDRMNKASVSNTHKELYEASEILSDVLDVDIVGVTVMPEDAVLFETADGSFVKAVYEIGDSVKFTCIEEFVVSESTEVDHSKSMISEMLDSILAEDDAKAETQWQEVKSIVERVMKMGRKKKSAIATSADNALKMGSMAGFSEAFIDIQRGVKDPKKAAAAKRGWAKRRSHLGAEHAFKKQHSGLYKARRQKFASLKNRAKSLSKGGNRVRVYYSRNPNSVREHIQLAENISEYMAYKAMTPFSDSTFVEHDEVGNVVAVSMPTSRSRNEAKVMQWKVDTLKSDLTVLREQAKRLAYNEHFCKAIAGIKRFNNISDNAALEEGLSSLIGKFPHVLYLTHNEMTQVVHSALKTMGASNYDDQICNFISEGILRTAFDAYPDKVARIAELSTFTIEGEDPYASFQDGIEVAFKKIDENTSLESKMFEDLYNSFAKIENMAEEFKDTNVSEEISVFLSELEAVIEGRHVATMELANEATEWLVRFIESNLEPVKWDVVDTPYQTVNGYNPQADTWSKRSYSPSADLDMWKSDKGQQIGGDTNDLYAGSDEGASRGMSNKGKDTWPTLVNPYLPKSLVPKINNDDNVEDNDVMDTFGGSDVWPNLENPYLPKSIVPKINN